MKWAGMCSTAVLLLSACESSIPNEASINDVIGDVSFIESYGVVPNEQTQETLRIRTHLRYVEMLLRDYDVNLLSTDKRARRIELLDHLHDYWISGLFPRNYDYTERRPCFIDRDGRICAVG